MTAWGQRGTEPRSPDFRMLCRDAEIGTLLLVMDAVIGISIGEK